MLPEISNPLVVNAIVVDAISVKKTEKSVKNEIVLRPPNSKAWWGGGGV